MPCVFPHAGVLEGAQAYNKRARVGATPGLTRQVAGFQVSAEPCAYMLDTPGIMIPAIPSDEVGFRLALAGRVWACTVLHAACMLDCCTVGTTIVRVTRMAIVCQTSDELVPKAHISMHGGDCVHSAVKELKYFEYEVFVTDCRCHQGLCGW